MPSLVPIRRALLSVSDKTDLVPFARGLRDLGVEIVSTGGTARALAEADVDVLPIEDVTGFPEMMDGRVKTLHPAVHGALLGRRDDPTHLKAMDEHGITPMAWCPLGGVVYPAWTGTMSEEQNRSVEAELGRQSEKYGAKPWVVILAWLLRHPSGIAPIVGSTQASRIAEAVQALDIDYQREDWYRLLEARNGEQVP